MTTESAIALILVTMDSLAHRQDCLRGTARDLSRELITEALAVLEAA
jgi:heme exporter protein D